MGCCITIILIFIALCALFIYTIAGLVILDITFLILFLGSWAQKENAKKMKPSKMVCQNCKSTHVKLSTQKSGKSTTSTFYSRNAQHNTTIHYKRIAECKECGFTWDYIMQEDIDKIQANASGMFALYGFIFIILIAVSIWILI